MPCLSTDRVFIMREERISIMVYDNIEFFDIAELKNNENGGKSLLRFPFKTIEKMHSEYSASCCKGCEIRFVSDSKKLELEISSDDDSVAKVMIYRGDYYIKTCFLKAKERTVIELEEPERFSWVEKSALVRKRFSTDVWRIIFDTGLLSFYSLNAFGGSVRPPKADEVPSKKWIAYGSSITYGESAFLSTSSYIQQAAYRLNVDVLNKACSGACAVENVTADYFSKEDWDFITLEIGVNMRNVITSEEFKNRTIYMVDKLKETHPYKKIFVITMLPNNSIRAISPNEYTKDHIEFNKILTELCSVMYKDSNVVMIKGETLLPDFRGLTADLIHPSDYGHIMIGEKLSEILKENGVV